MNFFRSEDHITRWLDDRRPGVTLSVAQSWSLADAWWADRVSPDWRPHTRDQNQTILDGLGLTGDFWHLS